ncbi:MAG TPA: hypothetical protein VF021_10965 [Longimicrobiales bacterium]
MFKRWLPLVALLAGCAAKQADGPPPSWIVGKYHYAGNGTVAGKFPWQAKSDLLLDRDGQYTLSVSVHIDDEKGGDTDTDESYGTYFVDGDKLILEPAHEDDSDDAEQFEIRGHHLVPRLPWPARLALKGFRIPDPVFVKTE